jgi:hypothetical protein
MLTHVRATHPLTIIQIACEWLIPLDCLRVVCKALISSLMCLWRAVIYYLRSQRMELVQSLEQYRFIFKVLRDFVKLELEAATKVELEAATKTN